MATRTQEPSTVQTVYRERATRLDVRELAPPTGLLEYWYPAIEDQKVNGKPVGLKICNQQTRPLSGQRQAGQGPQQRLPPPRR